MGFRTKDESANAKECLEKLGESPGELESEVTGEPRFEPKGIKQLSPVKLLNVLDRRRRFSKFEILPKHTPEALVCRMIAVRNGHTISSYSVIFVSRLCPTSVRRLDELVKRPWIGGRTLD